MLTLTLSGFKIPTLPSRLTQDTAVGNIAHAQAVEQGQHASEEVAEMMVDTLHVDPTGEPLLR